MKTEKFDQFTVFGSTANLTNKFEEFAKKINCSFRRNTK
jgi:hypothetical protein